MNKYKLVNIESDMWSRMSFQNIDTGLKIYFECDNNVMYSLLKKSFPDNTKFIDWEDTIENEKQEFEYPEYPSSFHDKNDDSPEIKQYFVDLNNYYNQEGKEIQRLKELHKNDDVIYVNDYGEPIVIHPDKMYPNLFSLKELRDLKYKETEFLTFSGKKTEKKINTFAWGFYNENDEREGEFVNQWQDANKEREELIRNPKLDNINWEFDE